MAVFGAPVAQEEYADRALAAALAMHQAQEGVNEHWRAQDMPPFGLGIGLSTGEAAAALLGSDERLECTVVGYLVNLSQRLQQFVSLGQTVLSEATWAALSAPPDAEKLAPELVKGRHTPVVSYRIGRATSTGGIP